MKHQTRLITASLSALFLLVGCQSNGRSEQEYFSILDSWKGKTDTALVSARGTPDQFYQSGNTKYLTYNTSSLNNEKSNMKCTSTANTGNIISSSRTNCHEVYCKETFELIDNKIQKIIYEGNNCY